MKITTFALPSILLASAEFTTATETYGNGTIDPGVASLKYPVRFQDRAYESYNTMAGGTDVSRSR